MPRGSDRGPTSSSSTQTWRRPFRTPAPSIVPFERFLRSFLDAIRADSDVEPNRGPVSDSKERAPLSHLLVAGADAFKDHAPEHLQIRVIPSRISMPGIAVESGTADPTFTSS